MALSRWRCLAAGKPSGLARCRIGSPWLRNVTPRYAGGRKALSHSAVPAMSPGPLLESITAKPGRFADSLPSPYVTHEPMLGAPNRGMPHCIRSWAGSWLAVSVCMLRIMHRSSAHVARCGR